MNSKNKERKRQGKNQRKELNKGEKQGNKDEIERMKAVGVKKKERNVKKRNQ